MFAHQASANDILHIIPKVVSACRMFVSAVITNHFSNILQPPMTGKDIEMMTIQVNIDHVIAQINELSKTSSRSRAQELREQIQQQIDALVDEPVETEELLEVSDIGKSGS